MWKQLSRVGCCSEPNKFKLSATSHIPHYGHFLKQTQTKPDKYSRKTTTIKLHKKSCSNFACVCVCCVYNKEKSLEILPFACVYVCIPTKLVSRSRSQHKKQALLQHPNYICFLYFFLHNIANHNVVSRDVKIQRRQEKLSIN